MSVDRPHPPITYDGGMGYNNPSEVALNEAQRIWPGCMRFGLISIGIGQSKANSIQLSDADEANIPTVVIRSWVKLILRFHIDTGAA